ncbi:MAG: hypothetical protein FJ038_13430, partial [Chloroflexi bacterium]|nr:hypothetical protein [Chloroflexota bacterium]
MGRRRRGRNGAGIDRALPGHLHGPRIARGPRRGDARGGLHEGAHAGDRPLVACRPGRWSAAPQGDARGVVTLTDTTRLVDSHCHLQSDRFAADADAVVAAARLAGVERILVPGWNLRSSLDAFALAERISGLDVAAGIHPHDASGADARTWRAIERLAARPDLVAIGETGLDYDRVFSPIEVQLASLRRHLELARAAGLPLVLHCRSAAGRRDAQDALLAELDAAGIGGG